MEQKQSANGNLELAREAVYASPARQKLAAFFDKDTFVETGVFVKRKGATDDLSALEGVVTGYGAVGGQLVYAFAQDISRLHGAIDENHAKKIKALYRLALNNGAPVVAIFASCGASIYEGAAAMGAYGKIIATVSEASGHIPQIAILDGPVTGTLAAVAAMFDFVVKSEEASLYVYHSDDVKYAASEEALLSLNADFASCLVYVRNLINVLPATCETTAPVSALTDDPNRPLSCACFAEGTKTVLDAVCDNGNWMEVNASAEGAATTAFASVGGVSCGIVATDPTKKEGKLTLLDARKVAHFVRFCSAYGLPVVTFVDATGFAIDANDTLGSAELARLAMAYTQAEVPMVTLYLGKAIGSAYILLGSSSLGADITYALPHAEIGVMTSEAAVAFAKNNQVKSPESRKALEDDFRSTYASAMAAASCGEVDDVIDPMELRARICSALYMLRGEGPSAIVSALDTL